ncbi:MULTISPECIES: hypothetical protein [Photorhabdus]|uniref:RpoE leader peptide RseD n=1 Tax=Photorhabdus kayaii TaxID=230088 RepID=A0ABX0B5X9_9GAMM|nr:MULTISPECIES: hypothetical protein [Photorhabdus]MCC8375878.1 hypothetical protein [Photorhabdus bodei]MCT8352466.1 hypothetical protein [Photorhabdus kayaii]NDL13174.1 hypothetical protein [Photorhabdus kayaii]NDL26968.1 hypothetical protein [Photorhabdus kayaii]
MTGVSECSQQRGNLKDDGYIIFLTWFSLSFYLHFHFWTIENAFYR